MQILLCYWSYIFPFFNAEIKEVLSLCSVTGSQLKSPFVFPHSTSHLEADFECHSNWLPFRWVIDFAVSIPWAVYYMGSAYNMVSPSLHFYECTDCFFALSPTASELYQFEAKIAFLDLISFTQCVLISSLWSVAPTSLYDLLVWHWLQANKSSISRVWSG